jgi:hypothetical protein
MSNPARLLRGDLEQASPVPLRHMLGHPIVKPQNGAARL